ncbi:tetratricopeptide repeat protein [Halalkalibacter urbisdiaboli]|uniref:tetratricopeptide repeat protein n=1 Tax=Halalkalibacter urbisdiaboli TaxID=1960589 RepID=UPI001FD98E44|nr:tetratricopeptide repeat protein [Halalkalibacter urbisdiaboli]
MINAIEKAMDDIEAGKVEEGLSTLEKVSKTADHETKYSIAEVYYELGHLDKAKALIEELLMLYPDEGSLFIFLAEIMIDANEEDEAIDLLLEVSEEDPTYLQAQLLLADLYQMQALDEVAEQKLLSAAKKAPDEVVISYGLGEFYLDRGDYVKSIPYLKKALHQKDELPNVHIELKLAEAYSASGQFEEAMQYYREGLTDHLDPHALFGYGFTAFQIGDMIIAIEQLEALKALDPDFTSLYPYLAKAYEAENRIDEAVETLKDGMAVDEYNEQLYILAGKLSFKQHRPEDGEHFLRKVIALNPSNIEAIHTLAAYLKHDKQFEELLELISHTKSYGEDDPLLTWYEAVALKEADDYEGAFQRFLEVEKGFAEDPDFLEEFGYFLLEYGMREKAIDCFQSLMEMDSSRLEIKELLDELK